MYIAVFAFSVVSLALFLLSTILIYNKQNSEYVFDIRNHFTYELWLKKDTHNSYLGVLLFLSVASFTVNSVLFTINHFGVLNLMQSVMHLVIAFSVVTIFILPLSKLKERCVFSILLTVGVTILNGVIIFQCVNMMNQLEEKLVILPIVVSTLIVVIGIFTIFNPNLFNFNMSRDKEGNLIRPKIIFLALSEWLLVLSFLFSQV